MVQPSSHPTRKDQRFTGPRHQRYTSLIEARKSAEIAAAAVETAVPTSRPVPRPTLISTRQEG